MAIDWAALNAPVTGEGAATSSSESIQARLDRVRERERKEWERKHGDDSDSDSDSDSEPEAGSFRDAVGPSTKELTKRAAKKAAQRVKEANQRPGGHPGRREMQSVIGGASSDEEVARDIVEQQKKEIEAASERERRNWSRSVVDPSRDRDPERERNQKERVEENAPPSAEEFNARERERFASGESGGGASAGLAKSGIPGLSGAARTYRKTVYDYWAREGRDEYEETQRQATRGEGLFGGALNAPAEGLERGGDFLLDNPAFSVQREGRGALGAALGTESDAETGQRIQGAYQGVAGDIESGLGGIDASLGPFSTRRNRVTSAVAEGGSVFNEMMVAPTVQAWPKVLLGTDPETGETNVDASAGDVLDVAMAPLSIATGGGASVLARGGSATARGARRMNPIRLFRGLTRSRSARRAADSLSGSGTRRSISNTKPSRQVDEIERLSTGSGRPDNLPTTINDVSTGSARASDNLPKVRDPETSRQLASAGVDDLPQTVNQLDDLMDTRRVDDVSGSRPRPRGSSSTTRPGSSRWSDEAQDIGDRLEDMGRRAQETLEEPMSRRAFLRRTGEAADRAAPGRRTRQVGREVGRRRSAWRRVSDALTGGQRMAREGSDALGGGNTQVGNALDRIRRGLGFGSRGADEAADAADAAADAGRAGSRGRRGRGRRGRRGGGRRGRRADDAADAGGIGARLSRLFRRGDGGGGNFRRNVLVGGAGVGGLGIVGMATYDAAKSELSGDGWYATKNYDYTDDSGSPVAGNFTVYDEESGSVQGYSVVTSTDPVQFLSGIENPSERKSRVAAGALERALSRGAQGAVASGGGAS